METCELAKVYMSCIKNEIPVSEGFKREMNDVMLNQKLPGCEAAALPYILPLLISEKIENKPDISKVRESVLKIMR